MASLASHFVARIVLSLGSAAMASATLSGCAYTGATAGLYADERCQAVSELPDGSWRVDRPIMFGRTVRVEGGATLYKTEVIDGIDLGAVLQRTCRDPSQNVPATVARF
jgi:hypothetical protein